MKRMPAIFAALIVLVSFSCNNSGSEKEEKKAADTTAAVTATPEVTKPVFTPFKVFMIQHRVKNFDKWKVGYFAHDSVRKAYDLTHYIFGRDLKDSNMIYILNKMGDAQKAKTFSTLPNLKEAMKKAGVTGPPTFTYAEVIRNDDSPTEFKDRVMVTHHVKDFDAWVKVYDGEGVATRAANGLIDRGMARGIDDPNMVTVVFAISDMAKAKARTSSPELKKLMTDAGVDSPPQIKWFRIVE